MDPHCLAHLHYWSLADGPKLSHTKLHLPRQTQIASGLADSHGFCRGLADGRQLMCCQVVFVCCLLDDDSDPWSMTGLLCEVQNHFDNGHCSLQFFRICYLDPFGVHSCIILSFKEILFGPLGFWTGELVNILPLWLNPAGAMGFSDLLALQMENLSARARMSLVWSTHEGWTPSRWNVFWIPNDVRFEQGREERGAWRYDPCFMKVELYKRDCDHDWIF